MNSDTDLDSGDWTITTTSAVDTAPSDAYVQPSALRVRAGLRKEYSLIGCGDGLFRHDRRSEGRSGLRKLCRPCRRSSPNDSVVEGPTQSLLGDTVSEHFGSTESPFVERICVCPCLPAGAAVAPA